VEVPADRPQGDQENAEQRLLGKEHVRHKPIGSDCLINALNRPIRRPKTHNSAIMRQSGPRAKSIRVLAEGGPPL
jgi:hypothetical protein